MKITNLHLLRLQDNTIETRGFLTAGDLGLYTIELPDKNNQVNISRIPNGLYTWKKFNSPSKGSVILLEDVPNRSMIEIHIANYVTEIRGCISVGKHAVDINGDGVIDNSSSGKAMKELLDIVADKGIISVMDVTSMLT